MCADKTPDSLRGAPHIPVLTRVNCATIVSMLTADQKNTIQSTFDRQGANCVRIATTSLRERQALLKKLKRAIIVHADALAEAIYKDFRKAKLEVEITEIHPVLEEINHTLRHLKEWMRDKTVPTPPPFGLAHSRIRYQPRGRVLIVSPWNYPFNLLIAPLVAAIAAGNCVILKPSEKVPQTAKLLAQLIGEVFSPDHVALFEGGADLGDFLITLPFDHFFFTGNPRIGKKVMLAAAQHNATVTLELGGKSPAIIDPSADLQLAAQRIVWGKFVNAGQTCVAPDYVLVPRSHLEEFINQAKSALQSFYGKHDQLHNNPDFCRIVDDAAFVRLTNVLQESLSAGAVIEVGGQSRAAERYLAPTLLSKIDYSSPIMREEIFGPILPILTYEKRAEVLEDLRLRPTPLALYIFAQDHAAIDELLTHSKSGGAVVNNVLLHVANPNLPFGGFGMSGQGSYHGRDGFLTFSHARAVLFQGRGNAAQLLYPPYTRPLVRFVQRLVGFLDRSLPLP